MVIDTVAGEPAILEIPRERLQPSGSSAQPRLRVALAQIAPVLGGLERNLQLHEDQIAAARAGQADLIIFPELSLTGYFLRDMVPDVALSATSAEIDRLLKASDGLSLVAGFVERHQTAAFYNSVFYAENGRLLHVHRKVYLPTYGLFDEHRYFAPGDRIQAFDTEWFGRVGLLVCEDFWHLSVATIMQAEGVDMLICVANSPARGVQGPRVATAETYEHLCKTFARLLGAVVVLVNRVGYEDGLCFWGGSMVVGPGGEILAEAPQLDESLTLVEIDPAELRRQRVMTPLARDERLLLTIEELNRIKRQRYEQ